MATILEGTQKKRQSASNGRISRRVVVSDREHSSYAVRLASITFARMVCAFAIKKSHICFWFGVADFYLFLHVC